MRTEWEAAFWPVEKDDVRRRLREAGATLVYEERLMRRVIFHLPSDAPLTGGWARVRDEGDKVTLCVKQVGTTMEDQKELEVQVSNYDDAIEILKSLGCIDKAYQETKRELWELGGAEIMLDEWPFLEPLVEVEGPSEEVVKDAAERLMFEWETAIFDTVDLLYSRKYGVERRILTTGTGARLTFDIPNPFQT